MGSRSPDGAFAININYNKTTSINLARKQLNECKEKFKLPLNFNPEEFRLVCNGVFQAEGNVYCRIRGKTFSPVFSINQNFSPKSLELFLTL